MVFALSALEIHSNSFFGNAIPARCSKEGGNVSPHLAWRDAPPEAQSFALICHDPDAPAIANGQFGFTHWLLYNIPKIDELAENSDIGTCGLNGYGDVAYGGPHPPAGHGPHRYYFVLFALCSVMKLPQGLSLRDLLQHIEPDVIGMNRLVGVYETPV